MRYTLFTMVLLLFAVATQAQDQEHRDADRGFFVGLYNGERIYANRIQQKSPLFKGDYFLLDDTLRLPTNSIKYYQNRDGFYVRLGDPRGQSVFAKRVISGRISKYYTTVMDYRDPFMYGRPYGMGYGGMGMGYGGMWSPWGMGGGSRRLYFFSKDGSELVDYNVRNLREAVADNQGSLTMIRQYQTSRVVETGLSIVGVGLLVYGMNKSIQQNPYTGNVQFNLSPLVYVGAGALGAPILMRLFKKDKLTQAIELYNYQER